MHFATTLQNSVAHGLYHAWQLISAYMGVHIRENGFRSTMLTKHLQNLLHAAALFAARVELAIAVGSSSTLTKTVIARGIHLLRLRDECQILLAVAHILSTFQHNRTQAQFNQPKCCKQATRAGTHHDNRWFSRNIGIIDTRKRLVLRKLIDVNAHFEIDKNLPLSCINTAPQHTHLVNGAHINAMRLCHIGLDAVFRKCYGRCNSYLPFLNHACKVTQKWPHPRNLSPFLLGMRTIIRIFASCSSGVTSFPI